MRPWLVDNSRAVESLVSTRVMPLSTAARRTATASLRSRGDAVAQVHHSATEPVLFHQFELQP